MKCRLLETGCNTGFFNMALDEVMLSQVEETKVPTLRFYGWKPACISIGYFQNVTKQVNEAECEKRGVDIVRRMTGGGTVYHKDELTYTIITPLENPLAADDILQSYKNVSQGLIESLNLMGVEADFRPLNDLVSGGRKISGNAQTRKKHCMLQHGTILLNVDAVEMFRLLRVESEKMRDKMIKAVEDSVTSVKKETGKNFSLDEASKIFAKGFEKALNLEYDRKPLSEEEKTLAEKTAQKKYSTREWNYMR